MRKIMHEATKKSLSLQTIVVIVQYLAKKEKDICENVPQ